MVPQETESPNKRRSKAVGLLRDQKRPVSMFRAPKRAHRPFLVPRPSPVDRRLFGGIIEQPVICNIERPVRKSAFRVAQQARSKRLSLLRGQKRPVSTFRGPKRAHRPFLAPQETESSNKRRPKRRGLLRGQKRPVSTFRGRNVLTDRFWSRRRPNRLDRRLFGDSVWTKNGL